MSEIFCENEDCSSWNMDFPGNCMVYNSKEFYKCRKCLPYKHATPLKIGLHKVIFFCCVSYSLGMLVGVVIYLMRYR